MIRRTPRATRKESSAASDVYRDSEWDVSDATTPDVPRVILKMGHAAVSYTHPRANETGRNFVCRLLLGKTNMQR